MTILADKHTNTSIFTVALIYQYITYISQYNIYWLVSNILDEYWHHDTMSTLYVLLVSLPLWLRIAWFARVGERLDRFGCSNVLESFVFFNKVDGKFPFWQERYNARGPPGVQTAKDESKIQNIQSNRKTKNQKSKRDDNRHERKRTWNRGGKSKRCICYEHDVQWRSSYSRYRQTIPQHGPTQWGHCPRLLSLSCFGRFM